MKTKWGQRGMMLISAYLTLSVLSSFTLFLFSKHISIYHASARTINRIVAFHLAESAVDHAIVELRTRSSYTGQNYAALGRGGYEVQVETPDAASPTVRRITATGHAPDNVAASYAYERKQVLAYVNFSLSAPGDYALFSDQSIQMSGNAGTDSYDSRQGPYRSDSSRAKGAIGTNATRAGFVTMSGNVRIRGDAVVGPGADPNQVIRTSGNVRIDGDRLASPTLKVLDPVVVPPDLVNLGSLTANGNDTITLGSGNYSYSSISISGNGRVNFTGPATVYVSGNLSISGNGIGTAGSLPPNLNIKVAGARNVSFNGNANFYGSVYAPVSDFQITGNGEMFGSLAGKTLQMSGNAKVHYDEALSQTVGEALPKTTDLLAWTET